MLTSEPSVYYAGLMYTPQALWGFYLQPKNIYHF